MEEYNIMTTYGLPDDWVYQVKKALNYGIYSNPLYFCELSETIEKNIENKVRLNNLVSFELNDTDKEIKFAIDSSTSSVDLKPVISKILIDSIMEFFERHKGEIGVLIANMTGKFNYAATFEDMLHYGMTSVMSNLITYFTVPDTERPYIIHGVLRLY
jgi:hypothetical protein